MRYRITLLGQGKQWRVAIDQLTDWAERAVKVESALQTENFSCQSEYQDRFTQGIKCAKKFCTCIIAKRELLHQPWLHNVPYLQR